MSIPQDGNFLGLSCQLGGLRMNGIVNYSTSSPVPTPTPTSGTAQSLTVLTIDDPAVVQTPSRSTEPGYLQVNIGGTNYYIKLYQ
jgi:hypothetical protein